MQKIKSVLFVGAFYSDNLIQTAYEDSKGFVSFSNHNFEMSILHGLSNNEGANLRCVSLPSNFSFPYHHKKIFTKRERYLKDGISVLQSSLCNLAIINLLWGTVSTLFSILNQLKRFNDNKVYIIVNCPKYQLMQALNIAMILSPKKIETVLIIPDIPSIITSSLSSEHKIKSFFYGIIDKATTRLANKFDHFVFLTENMKALYAENDYIVMEGLIDEKVCLRQDPLIYKKIQNQVLLYSGSLNEIYGILDLIEAFIKGQFKNTELWICGSGDASNRVIEFSKINTSIIYFGLVCSSKAIELQKQATILVNPRTNKGEYTKYSFPSKTIEYLLANKPVIMHRLDGVPKEYYEYVYTPKNESIDALTQTIQDVLLMNEDDKRDRAMRGMQFILNKKNATIQMRRILDLFNEA